jgi:ATP-dependent Clp protease ATP-binding subunit ClpA
MFERFTERSRRVVVLAQEESRMLDHNYIGTEHLLLGLIHERDGIAAQAIESTGLTLAAARSEVEAMIGRGVSAPTGHIPFTPRAKRVLELGLREALALKKTYIGPEHILLGLIREGDGVGAQILERLAAPLPVLRAQVIELAAAEATEPEQDEPLGAEWSPAGAQEARAGLRRPARAVSAAQTQMIGAQERAVTALVVSEFRQTLASLDETLATLGQRLDVIERQLGIAPAGPEDSAPPEDAAPPEESAASKSAASEEAPPGEESPTESAE